MESTDPGPGPDLSSTDAMPASRHNADLSGLSAYRVALGRDPARGTLDVVPLAAGEPAPAGRIAVVLLAVDIGSSLSLAELFSKVRAADGRTQHKTRK